MGLSKSINKITKKEFKNTQNVLNALEILGIDESMLEDLKHLKEIKDELNELREFKNEVISYLKTESNKNNNEMGSPKDILAAMSEPIEEFKPYGR